MTTTKTISTTNGHHLTVLCFASVDNLPVKGSIVICPATGVLSFFYHNIARYLATQGFCVYTFDYRGIGLPKGQSLKGFEANLSDWAVDIQTVGFFAKEQNENVPLFALAHSIGGQLLALANETPNWDGILTVASQSGYRKHFEGIHRIKIGFFLEVALPFFAKTLGYFPAKRLGMFENLPKGVALQWNSWSKQSAYMKVEFNDSFFEKITCKIKAYSLADDVGLAPQSAVDWLHQQYTNARVERVHINPKDLGLEKIGHFNFFRSYMKDILWKDVNSFFQEIVAEKQLI